MKRVLLTRQLALSAGILLVFPSFYFVVSAWLNYGPGFSSLWKIIEPIFDKPENQKLGFNINLLILFGPLLAIIINLPQLFHINFNNSNDDVNIRLVVKKYSWSWIIISAALLCLAAISFYLIGENCRC